MSTHVWLDPRQLCGSSIAPPQQSTNQRRSALLRKGPEPAQRARNPEPATAKFLHVFKKQKLKSFSKWLSKHSCSYQKSKKVIKCIKINLCWKNISRGNWMNPLPRKTQLWSLKSFSKFKLTTSNRYSPLQSFLYPLLRLWSHSYPTNFFLLKYYRLLW